MLKVLMKQGVPFATHAQLRFLGSFLLTQTHN